VQLIRLVVSTHGFQQGVERLRAANRRVDRVLNEVQQMPLNVIVRRKTHFGQQDLKDPSVLFLLIIRSSAFSMANSSGQSAALGQGKAISPHLVEMQGNSIALHRRMPSPLPQLPSA